MLAQNALGGAQSLFVIPDRDAGLQGKRAAEILIGTLIWTRKISPCVGEALHRRGYDAEADHNHQRHKPARVEDVGQARGIEEAQHGGRVGARHVVGLRHRALQNHSAGRREDDDQDDENHASLDRAQGLPAFAKCGAE